MIHCAIGIEKTRCVLVLIAFAKEACSRSFQPLGAFCASLQIEKKHILDLNWLQRRWEYFLNHFSRHCQ